MGNLPIPKKSLGQHWLNDKVTLENICDLAELTKTDTVLEIGPGLGGLTELLTKQAGQVIAVEVDRNLFNRITKLINASNLTVLNQSILKFDLTTLPNNYKLVANIPYYLTSNLLRILSESSNAPISMVLLLQKEVAERVSAKVGNMSLLSITTQFFWEVNLHGIVQAKLFTPSPKVDSQIVVLNRRSTLLFPGLDTKAFFRLIKVGFSSRRKTILNSLSNGLRVDKNKVSEILQQSNTDPNIRPQMLDINQWHEIYKIYVAIS